MSTARVFLVCYNELPLLPHAVRHYRQWLPGCSLTVLDNHSTDGSDVAAARMGCAVLKWTGRPGMLIDDIALMHLKNEVWKGASEDWVVVADMDEWLCVREADLARESAAGTSVLTTVGADAVGHSEAVDLSDADPHAVTAGKLMHGKHVCFRPALVRSMNYMPGAHLDCPQGVVAYSARAYLLKHMNFMGLPFYHNKIVSRFRGNVNNLAFHYTEDAAEIRRRYEDAVASKVPFALLAASCEPAPRAPPPLAAPPGPLVVDLVVSRTDEGLSWLGELGVGRFRRVVVYNRGAPLELEGCEVVAVPDVGREAHAILRHVADNYDDLAEATVFLPGSAWADERSRARAAYVADRALLLRATVLPEAGQHPDFQRACADFAVGGGCEPCPERPFSAWYEKNFGGTPVSSFARGSALAVSRGGARRRPLASYRELIRYVDRHPDPEASHYLERAWEAVFGPPGA